MNAAELAQARKQLGLSVGQLALALVVERSTVHRWESGSRPIPRVVALAVECLQRRDMAGRQPCAGKTIDEWLA